MVKGIIKNTHIITSKITKFIWFIGYCNFSKMNMYFKTEGVTNIFEGKYNNILSWNETKHCTGTNIHTHQTLI